jgi:hypothetical protein
MREFLKKKIEALEADKESAEYQGSWKLASEIKKIITELEETLEHWESQQASVITSLITAQDKKTLYGIKDFINRNKGEWHEVDKMHEAIDRAVFNLEHGLNYYKILPESEKQWYDADCGHCGWKGSSQYLWGGGALADTGDFGDCYCPVCGKVN